MKISLPLLAGTWLALAACAHAQDHDHASAAIGAAESQFRETFRSPSIIGFGPAPIAGLFQVLMADKVLYFDPRAELLVFGEIWTKDGRSLTAETLARSRAERLNALPMEQSLTIGAGPTTVVEFLDTECPHCARYDEWIRTRTDVTRRIFLMVDNRSHVNSRAKAVHVLCSSNPSSALADVFANRVGLADLRDCQRGRAATAAQSAAAAAFGVSSTPTLLAGGQMATGFDPVRFARILDLSEVDR